MKEFAIKVGKDILELIIILIFGIIMFPLMLKAMDWFAGLFSYTLI